MNVSTILSRDSSLLVMVETPTEEVALMQMVETVFLAGINLNTLFIIHIQHMTIFYNKIPCKALHWVGQSTRGVYEALVDIVMLGLSYYTMMIRGHP